MKILFLNHNVKGRGTYVRCFNFAKHLAEFGHAVSLLTSTSEYRLTLKREVIDGVEVISLPDILGNRLRNGGLGPIDSFLRCMFVLNRQYDIVEMFDHRPAVLFPGLVSKYIQKKQMVVEWTDLHGTGGSLGNRPPRLQKLIRHYENFTERKSKLLGDQLVVISQGLKKLALNMGIPAHRISWIPGGADVDNIKPHNKTDAREKFGLPLNQKLVGYTGYSHYDMDMLLKAINILQQSRDDVWFVKTGAVLSDSLKAHLHDPKRLIELGFLSYPVFTKILPAMDAFIFPYADKTINTGRWPNKLGDYMAAGRPTVTNRTGDIVDAFTKNNIGFMAAEDPEDMANKMQILLSNDELAEQMGRNARKAAEEIYDWRILSKKLESIFLNVSRPEVVGK